jgi:hypothetical protein
MISGSARGFSPIGVGLVPDMVFNVLSRQTRQADEALGRGLVADLVAVAQPQPFRRI